MLAGIPSRIIRSAVCNHASYVSSRFSASSATSRSRSHCPGRYQAMPVTIRDSLEVFFIDEIQSRPTNYAAPQREKERCDNEIGPPDNRIEMARSLYPEAPAQRPQTPVLGSVVTAHQEITTKYRTVKPKPSMSRSPCSRSPTSGIT